MRKQISHNTDAIRVLPADLQDQKRSHTGASPAAERVAQLETLEAIAAVRLLPRHNQHRVDKLCTYEIASLRPIVARPSVRPNPKLSGLNSPPGRSRTDAVYGCRLEVHGNRAEHVASTGGLVVVRADTLTLEIRVTVVRVHGVDAVLVRDDLPELGIDVIVALPASRRRRSCWPPSRWKSCASLQAHCCCCCCCCRCCCSACSGGNGR